jgi:endo-1,4-beta-xylanase
MASLYSIRDVLGLPAEWNSTNQFIRLTVEIENINVEVVEAAPQPNPITPFRTLEDQKVPIDFEYVLARSEFDLSRALSGQPLHETFTDYFSLGVSINGINITNASVISHELAAITAYHFNSVVYSNLMKPDFLLDHQGSMANAAAGDEAGVATHFHNAIPGLEFARTNGLGMRGHTLVWHTQTPHWFFREGFRTDGEFVSAEIMTARLESYIRQVLTFTNEYFPGVIYAWDVVNEAVTTARGQYNNSTGWHTRTHHGSSENPIPNLWYHVLGPDYVRLAFYFARRYAAPYTRLFYNDYNTFQRDKTLAIVNLLTELMEEGLVDGMGMQSAMGLNWPASLRTGSNSVVQAINEFSALGLELQMTEHTVRIGSPDFFEEQAARYREFFEILLEMHEVNGGPANITNVTFFGLMDNYHFYANLHQYYWLFDYRLQPKPAFFAVKGVTSPPRD